MLTYSFEQRGQEPLYEFLYKQIKQDVITKKLLPDEQLPSKRALAKHLNISVITVENTYNQLLAEGYIYSVPRKGFYVCQLSFEGIKGGGFATNDLDADRKVFRETVDYVVDFSNSAAPPDRFPYTIWTRIMRDEMSKYPERLTTKSPSCGIAELREAIGEYLYQFRGMRVLPEQIIVGAGTEYLYGVMIQLLGRDKIYAVEDPCYEKIVRIYEANDVCCKHVRLDRAGVNPKELEESKADVLHISPNHHFPTGLITPVGRRYELLSWASEKEERFIIEDDYDSEFRFQGKPIPSLYSMDTGDSVIYVNTFSKSLLSTIRISYMVLPLSLLKKYREELSFYACTVSNFEQYTLARFLREGYFEKHINRMRTHYRMLRDTILCCIRNHKDYSKVTIREEDAGLHFLLEIKTKESDEVIEKRLRANGINISFLSRYYEKKETTKSHTLVISYSGMEKEKMQEAVDILFEALWKG